MLFNYLCVFREYTNNLNINILQYTQQKDFNNKFFASYTKFSPYHRSIINNKSNSEQFSDLFNEYQKINYPLSTKILKANIFKKDPLLLLKQEDLVDYYNRDDRKTSLIHLYDKDKSIITLNHLEQLAFDKLRQSGDKMLNGENEYKLVQRKLKKEQGLIDIPINRDKLKLEKEIGRHKDEVSFLNHLIDNHDTLYDCINKDLTKETFYTPKKNQQYISPYSLKKDDYKTKKILTTQKNIDNMQYSCSNKNKLTKSNSQRRITLSTSFLSFGKHTLTKLEHNINNSNRNSNIKRLDSNNKNDHKFNKTRQGKGSFKSSLIKQCSNKEVLPSKIENSQKTLLSDQELKRKELQKLYNRVKRINIFSKHKEANEIIDQLSFHFKKASFSTNSIKTILNSFSHLNENAQNNKIPSTMRKMYQSNIPIKTARRLEKLQEIDSNLSFSTEKIAKYVIGSQL